DWRIADGARLTNRGGYNSRSLTIVCRGRLSSHGQTPLANAIVRSAHPTRSERSERSERIEPCRGERIVHACRLIRARPLVGGSCTRSIGDRQVTGPVQMHPRLAVPGQLAMILPSRARLSGTRELAGVAQWQSTAFVKRGLWVRIPPSAMQFCCS